MVRKTVTLVFCDVAGSTPLGERLDPETLRDVWSRYHATARDVLERHGGTIEKFVGDAVMAAFGIPVVHEDDALRAVRAAVELREELTGLNEELERAYGVQIEVRTGINTGEVVAGDPAHGQAFATGDAVNVAQRLEVAAGGGEILIGDSTFRLVRDAVTVEPLPPLELKGKSEPFAAWRLLEVEHGVAGLTRRLDSPLVGRTAELARLGLELGRAKGERSCRTITILGEPGVGKSRLAAELVASLGEEAQVVEGRCLPYGSGITYWPLVEIVDSLDLDEVLGAEPDGEAIRGRILEALGRAEQRSRSDEIYWAVRRLLEALARDRPVVVVLDDIQWAEPAFLDLVEYLTGWSRDAPILLCCLARTEFAEMRPGWPIIALEPLSSADTSTLLENLAGPLDPATTRQLGRATGGNPLFLGEMLRMLVEDGALVERDGRLQAFSTADLLRVPDTVQAVLAARLDRLEADELAVLQRAAVIGQVFWWGAVADLSPEASRPDVSRHLQSLVRKGLIGPDARTFVGEDGFRFGHILIRDAAYDSTPKRLRAELHERFAEWGEVRVGDSVEFDEIIGHHLEQAHVNRLELAPAGPGTVAARAAERLARAGRRALTRGDASAATGLLGRAAKLDPSAALLLDLAEAYSRLGSIGEAEGRYRGALEAALAEGDRKTEICALLELEIIALFRGEGGVDEVARSVQRALPVFEEVGDDRTIASLLTALADAYWWRGQTVQMQQTLERALVHARRAADGRVEGDTAVGLGFAAVVGPLPIPEGRRLVAEAIEHAVDDTSAKGTLLMIGAMLAALDEALEEARDLAARGMAILDALGRSMVLAALSTWTSAVDLLAGDREAAERRLRAALDELNEAGQRANVASVAAQLAETLIASGRPDEAASFIEVSRDAAAPDDLHAQIAWRVAQAKILAAGGGGTDAERVAREAIALAESTDSPLFAADSLEALALALAATGKDAEAASAAREALQLHESKGNCLGAERVRTLRLGARTASTPG
jgi:class 3 adenylate cyclase/tetratricopeptide (TPR) repeat protein